MSCHGVVDVKHVKCSIDLLVDRATAHKRETVGDFLTIKLTTFIVIESFKYLMEACSQHVFLGLGITKVVFFHHVYPKISEFFLVEFICLTASDERLKGFTCLLCIDFSHAALLRQ